MARNDKATPSIIKPCPEHDKARTKPRSANGAASHAAWCAAFRKVNGIPDTAPGVRQSKSSEPVTLSGVLAAMTARATVTPTATAGETVKVNGVTLSRADAAALGLLK